MELVDGQGMAVANRSLSFTMYRPNGQQFMNGVSFITDANGMTSFSFTPDVVGTYTVTVNFAGDAEYGASTTSVAIDVVADVGYDYKVASNVVLNATGGTAYTGTNFAEALKWATSQANKVVYVPTGTYAISGLDEACITPFASGVTLYGDGPDSTIFDFEYTGTFMSHADQNEYGWTFGLQGVNVSNVTIKQLGITGDGNVAFLTKTGTTSNNVVEDVTVFDTSHHNMGAFRVCPAVNTVANDYSFIRCTADNSGGDGFDIMGEYGSDRSTWGKVYRTYFEDCTALYCGYSSHRWNWAVGFDLRESCQHYDYTLVRCRADYNWESGFHAEFDSSSTMGTVTFTNCTANYNGQKYSQPSGACNGLGMVNGYGLYSNWGTKPNPVYDPDDDVTYYVTNFTGTGNSGGNYATGTSRYYNCDNDQVIGWTYRINPSAPNNVYVPAQSWESLPRYTTMGTTLHQTFSSATAALQYCLSQPNAVVWLRNGTVTVTGDLTFASNVCLIGDLPTWNCVPSCSYISFPSTGTTGLVLGTGARVLCIGVNYGNVKVNATTAVSGIILRDVKLYNTSSERTAAIILAASGSGSINNTSLGNVHAMGAVSGCLLSGNVAEPSFTLCSGMTATTTAYDYTVSSNVVLNATGGTAYTGSSFTTALRWALTQTGKVTYVPSGTYNITGVLSPTDGITLVGDGPDRTILNFTATDYWFNRAFRFFDRSNVTLKGFGLTNGSIQFQANGVTITNIRLEDLTAVGLSAIDPAAFWTRVSNMGEVNGVTFIRCHARDTHCMGFEISGDRSNQDWTTPETARLTAGWSRNIRFEDCSAINCGAVGARYNDYVCGYDFNEGTNLENLYVLNCESSGNWMNGFHFEMDPYVLNAVFENCVANFNGVGPQGAGFTWSHTATPQEVTLINCSGYGNLEGDALMFPRPPVLTDLPPLEEVYDYTVSSNVVLNATGGTAYTGSSFATALQWALNRAGTTIYVPAGTYVVGSTIVGTASNVTLIGDGPQATIFTATSEVAIKTVNASNITMRGLGFTGAIGIEFVGHLTNALINHLYEDISMSNISSVKACCFMGWLDGTSSIDGLTFSRCDCVNTGCIGFELIGGATSNTNIFSNVLFDDCIASHCGTEANHYNDWVVGFDFNEGSAQTNNLTVVNCVAEYCFEAGFHFETGNQPLGTVSLQNCVSNYNGQKPANHVNYENGVLASPNGPWYAGGYFLGRCVWNLRAKLVSCSGTGNISGVYGSTMDSIGAKCGLS
jgi:hypothetical protein